MYARAVLEAREMVCAALDSLPAQGNCAVVLQGGALMAQKWGFEIDRHESVWRLNMHALVPKHTGERTTMNVVTLQAQGAGAC